MSAVNDIRDAERHVKSAIQYVRALRKMEVEDKVLTQCTRVENELTRALSELSSAESAARRLARD